MNRLSRLVLVPGSLVLGSLLGGQTVTPVHGDVQRPFEKGQSARIVEPDELLIEEKTLPFDMSINAPPDPGGEPSRGGKFYTFVLKPKEKLFVKLVAEESNHLGMLAVRPAHPDKMITEYIRLDRMPRALRSSQFQVQNTTDAPYSFVVMVYGGTGYWYKLKLERKS